MTTIEFCCDAFKLGIEDGTVERHPYPDYCTLRMNKRSGRRAIYYCPWCGKTLL